MKIRKVTRFCSMLALLAGLAGAGTVDAAQEIGSLDTDQELKEMPVLTGEMWQTLQSDAKVAFIWGVGHVVTIEEHVMQRHPELQRVGFEAKLAEGLRGVPMNSIIKEVDTYYQKYPEDLDLPVLRVIWSRIVKPKLKTGIGDRPLVKDDADR